MPPVESATHFSNGFPAVILSKIVHTHECLNNSDKIAIEFQESSSTVNCIGCGEKNTATAKDDQAREKWSRSIEFLLSCVAFSVGFGNVWRFPYIALKNGGGAFVIPYLIVLFLVGRPLYYLEMVVGQFSSRGCVKLYDCCPLMRGIGVGQTLVMFVIPGYYAAVLAIAGRYFMDSFRSPLPWSICRPEWWPHCISSLPGDQNNITNASSSSAKLYFDNDIMHTSFNINNGIGIPDWKLAIFLLACWICIMSMLIEGIRTSGKAAYVLAIFPYVILLILLVRSCTLTGALDGIIHFFKPDWEKLYEVDVWYEAVTQCFFSLTIGMGSVIVFSSFNSFKQNIYRDAMIISWLDTFTSLLSGVIVFGVVGHLAHITHRDAKEIIQKPGPELIFITYPDAIAKMDFAPNFFAVMFFLMFILVGMGSITGVVMTVITSVRDRFPSIQTWKVVSIIALLSYCMGLVYITPGGFLVQEVVDYYGVTYPVLTLVILEIITLCWIYGVDRLCLDIRFMLGIKTGIYWRVCWGFSTLLIIITIFVMRTVKEKPFLVPSSYNVFGWCLYAFTVLQVVGWGTYAVASRPEINLFSKILHSLRPTKDWGPESAVLRSDYKVVLERHKEANDCSLATRVYRKLFQ